MSLRPIAFFAAAVLFPGLALADAKPDRGARFEQMLQQRFETLDRDGDGKVTPDEINSHHAERFGAADTNKDGRLDLAEYEAMINAMQRERIAARFARIDTDGDGGITAEDFGQRPAERMMRLDADGDGALTIEEMRAVRKKGGRHSAN